MYISAVTPRLFSHLQILRLSDPMLNCCPSVFRRMWVTECSEECVNVCACLTPFLANTMPQVVMYFSCFVGPCYTSSLSSHQTFILQKHIYISRDPAQPNLLGRVPLPLCPVITLSVCFMSYSVLFPPPIHTHTPFCSNPLLLKASLSFLSCSLFIPFPIALKKKRR